MCPLHNPDCDNRQIAIVILCCPLTQIFQVLSHLAWFENVTRPPFLFVSLSKPWLRAASPVSLESAPVIPCSRHRSLLGLIDIEVSHSYRAKRQLYVYFSSLTNQVKCSTTRRHMDSTGSHDIKGRNPSTSCCTGATTRYLRAISKIFSCRSLDFYVFFLYQLSFNFSNLDLIYPNFKLNVTMLCFNVH